MVNAHVVLEIVGLMHILFWKLTDKNSFFKKTKINLFLLHISDFALND